MTSRAAPRIPGEPGIWIIIFGDLIVFGLFFGIFAFYRQQAPLVFLQSQRQLNQGFGLLNTLLLLTGSAAVAKAIGLVRTGRPAQARRLNRLAMLTGAGFVVVKMFEYREKLSAGIGPATNDFFMLYFTFTGVHLLHVVVGLGALAILQARTRQPLSPGSTAVMEACAIFWHLVDILWIVLFAIFYLHR